MNWIIICFSVFCKSIQTYSYPHPSSQRLPDQTMDEQKSRLSHSGPAFGNHRNPEAAIFPGFWKPGHNYPVTNMLKYNIQPILLYIRNHLEQNISVDELACIACFSKDHFSRVFKTITGLSPCDYIISKRIERAQFLLLATDLSLNQILDQTGFRSASYFSRIFRKQTTYSPKQYRLQRG